MDTQKITSNPLADGKIGALLKKFAIPSVIAMLVNAIYNMVDQMFIGNYVGTLGNAATNVTFPITTVSIALALLIGQGGASKQNLELGAGNKKNAERAVGNMIIMGIVSSVVVSVVAILNLEPMLKLFGASKSIMPYAVEYGRIIIIGIPFAVLGTCLNNAIRADTSAKFAMASMVSGAVANIILDAIFVIPLRMGMFGAALATILGQILTCVISLTYVKRFKHIKLTKNAFKIDVKTGVTICALGMAPCINQMSMFVVQIVLNNLMKHYGELTSYGSDIPLACIGVVMKINMIFMAIVIGVGQGTQPIISYNYGAKSYKRCKETYMAAAKINVAISVFFFILFQIFPSQLLSMFGNGTPEYIEFGVLCFRIYLFMTFINGLQPLTSIFFTSIGKAIIGGFIALTRQIIFLLPLAVILPKFMGIKGIMYAAPIADLMACVLVFVFMIREFRLMSRESVKKA